MAYDPALADRIRQALIDRAGVTEKPMFGGLSFLLDGKMFCGIVKDDLMVRVGPERYEESLRRPHARPMDFTGRPMMGYVYVGPEGRRTQRMVDAWVARGALFVETLGPPARRRRRRKPT
jgi:TfoX/Sxy family transcriptional regulator of competence genes